MFLTNDVLKSIVSKIKNGFEEGNFSVYILENEITENDIESMVMPHDQEQGDGILLPALFLYFNGVVSDVDDLSGNTVKSVINIAFDLYGYSRINNVDIIDKIESIMLNEQIQVTDFEGNHIPLHNCRQVGEIQSLPVMDETITKAGRDDIVEFSGSFDVEVIKPRNKGE